MKMLIDFYDRLFLYYYNLKKNSDSTPEYFPIIIISFEQAVNLMFFVTLFFYFFGIDFSILPKVFLVITAGTLIFNFYIYVTKNRKDIVLKKNMKLSLWFKILSYFYFVASLLSPLVLIYFLNEFCNSLR